MSAQRRRQTEGGTRRMRAFTFTILRPDGSERIERFYADRRAMAARYAAAWARRMGFEVLGDERGKAA